MAKPRMITRTISTTVADVLCLDIETGEACNRSFTFPGVFKKDSEILKAAAKHLEATEPNVHAVHVVGIAKLETLYGMTEADFLANAIIMPAKDKSADSGITNA